jgi:hypothetical protein
MQIPTHNLAPYLITIVLLVFVVVRNMSTRKLRVERMWIIPLVLVLATVETFLSTPLPAPIGLAVAEMAPALAIGCIAGWYRGRLTHITVDPETHELTSRTSPIGVMLVAALFFIRYVLRAEFAYTPDARGFHSAHGILQSQAGIITDALMLFAVGMVVVQRLEMWLRCQKLLAEAIAAKAAKAEA